MRYPRKWQLAFVCLLALALLPFAPAPRGTAQATGYTFTDLGTLGGDTSEAFGIGPCGQVVGKSLPAGSFVPRPFVWANGVMTDIGALGGDSGRANSINQSGTIVGAALTGGGALHAFNRPQGGPMQDIGTLAGTTSEAYDVNASGQVVGMSDANGQIQDRAFIWQPGGSIQPLPAPPWGTPLRANGINDAGQVTGIADRPGTPTYTAHAFLTIGGVPVDIGTLGGEISFGNKVNNSGVVVGNSYVVATGSTRAYHAFRWKDVNGNNQSDPGEMIDLGLVSPTHGHSYAYDINNAGVIVGASETGSASNNVSRAFIWQDADNDDQSDPGELRDLNDVAPTPGWTFEEARAINDRGQIAGTGRNSDGKLHAFLLTPTNVGPSPCDATPTPTPTPGALQFAAATYTVGEGGGSAVISVSRTGGIDGAVSVNYATSNGTATAGSDYTAASGTLNFAAGETSKTFSVDITNDTVFEGDETVNLTLSSPGGGATLGTPSAAVLTITADNDPQPVIQFGSPTSSYTVTENSVNITAIITVTRTGNTNGIESVNYATSDGTATAGPDYTAKSGTLTFGPGDGPMTFEVSVKADALDEPDETVNLTLSSPTGGAVLGARSTATLTILDNNPSPTLSIGDLVGPAAVTEGNSGVTNANVPVTLSAVSAQTVTVNYATSDGTATQPGDYVAASGTLTFNPGETSKNIPVSVVGDTVNEANESFNVNLSSPTNATINDGQGVVTINDDDGPPALSVNDVTVDEGDAGTVAATFTVTLLPASGQAVTVNYTTSDGTATQPGDYIATAGTLNFAAGETSKTVSVTVNGDTLFEGNETFSVNLSGAANADIGDAQGVGTITDNETQPVLQFNSVTSTYFSSEGGPATITVTRTGASGSPVSVNYATSDGTATAGTDYTATSGTLSFAAGETSKTFSVPIADDSLDEDNETINLTLSSPGGGAALGARSTAVLTINDDDNAPAVSINDVSASEGNSGTTAFNFTVTLSAASSKTASVSYATLGGTATTDVDFTAATGTVTFNPGETTKTISVSVIGDTTPEGNETFSVNLSGAANAFLSDLQGVGTILNDDAAPTLSVSDVTVTEGNAGTTNAAFNVTLSAASGQTVTVNYATSDGTAVAGSDYTAAGTTTLTFNPGETTKPVNIPVIGDTLDEPNETFNVTLSSPTNATVNDGTGVGTINDDDGAPSLSVNDVTVAEGNSGTTAATFTITLLPASGQAVSVSYATSDGTAVAPGDYTATSGTVNFAAGETTKTVTVSVNGDVTSEADETFFVNLSGAVNATVTDNQGRGTILNEDGVAGLSINDVTLAEGNSGTTDFTFTVTLSPVSGQTVTVSYATANGTATAGSDYAAASGSLTFAPGETTKTFTVNVNGNTLDGPDKTFFVNLSDATNVSIADGQGVGTITDDDAAPTLSVSDVTVTEGNAGTTDAAFNVTLSAASGQTVTVNYATSDGTAVAGSDYTAAGTTTLTFNPGETTKPVNIPVIGDTLDEPNETFNVTLSSPTNATVNDGTGVGTINDDDGTPSLSVNDVTVAEGNSGTTAATFTITLLPASGQAVSVNYATSDGTATAGTDYAATSGTVNFAAGETTKTVTVNVNGDATSEADETFFVNLSGAVNATVTDNQGRGTILNDDSPTLRFSQATYPVGESAHFVTVTVTRAGDTAPAVSVNFATGDGTATERRDYTAASGRLQFAAGETSKTFDVLLTEDAYTEPEETINLTLSNPTGGAVLGAQLTATVNIAADNESPNPNPIDISSEFVRQHYHDFLNREPDASGLAFWTGEIEQCGADAACREVKRINVSAAFFLSIEFQQTGYLVYRTYKAAYGDTTSPNVEGTVPVVRLQEFLPDTRIIGDGLVVGPPGWEQKLEANKNAYMAEFASRQQFLNAFPASLTAAEFVDRLNQNAGGVLTQAERNQLVSDLSNGLKTRAQVLRVVAENNALQQNEFRRAFVLMQYYGYLRRNPDDAPERDLNYSGWKFWLDKLNDNGGNYVQAEMVKAFLDSIEYRTRFAP